MEWQNIWNKIRPHESLNYLTPEAYYLNGKPVDCQQKM